MDAFRNRLSRYVTLPPDVWEQFDHLDLRSRVFHANEDIIRVEDALPLKQRDAVILVLAAGLTYEEAGAIMNCSPGTIKSRVNRARAVLMDGLNGLIPVISNDGGQDDMDRSTLNGLVMYAEGLMARAA